jgi:hypothetical protein
MSNRTGRGGYKPKTTKHKVAAVEELLTGRISQSQPDVQSLPRTGAIARKQREFHTMDLSDIERRTMAHLVGMPVQDVTKRMNSGAYKGFPSRYDYDLAKQAQAEEAPDAGLRRYLNRGRFNAKTPA